MILRLGDKILYYKKKYLFFKKKEFGFVQKILSNNNLILTNGKMINFKQVICLIAKEDPKIKNIEKKKEKIIKQKLSKFPNLKWLFLVLFIISFSLLIILLVIQDMVVTYEQGLEV